MDNNWLSLRHLAYSLNLTVVTFLLWVQVRQSLQVRHWCAWFYGSLNSLMLVILQPWTSITIFAYINLLYFHLLKNSWLNQLLQDTCYLHNLHECLEYCTRMYGYIINDLFITRTDLIKLRINKSLALNLNLWRNVELSPWLGCASWFLLLLGVYMYFEYRTYIFIKKPWMCHFNIKVISKL
jgi:hypothetical protein